MLSSTHFLFGILSGLILNFETLFVLIIGFAALLPDLDHPNSIINRNLRLSKIIAFAFSHRRFWHTIWPGALIALAFLPLRPKFALAIAVGWLSHLFLDMLTIEGTMPFLPLKIKFKGFIKVGSFTEKIIAFTTFFSIILLIVF